MFRLETAAKKHRLCLCLVTVGTLAAAFVPVLWPDIHPLHVATLAAMTNLLWIWS